ncbi:hypothetical protein EDB84DRAFT_1564923 [Lactarius hengduanensis]|nr:hypothetical protein EDB84DRAFT_1564923 [Lactarius hengduanensis]
MPLLTALKNSRAFPFASDMNVAAVGPGEELGSPEFWSKMLISTCLVLLGGVLAGLTLGLMGLDELHLRVLSTSSENEKERKDAARVLKLLNKGRHWVLVVLLLGNVIVNESLPIFLDGAIGGGVAAIVISTTMIGMVSVNNTEHRARIIPQAVSVRHGLSIGARCVPVVLTLMYFFAPIAWPIAKLLDYVLGKSDVHTYKKAELKSFLQFHRTGEEPLRDDEISILNGVLELNIKSVEKIMTPMKDVVTLSSDTILDAKMIESLYAVQWILSIPDSRTWKYFSLLGLRSQLLTYDPSQCWPVSKFALSILPEAKPTINCFQALDYFQTGRAHLLLISNTPGISGGAIGVITLEEIIAEEIVDETDRYEDNQSKRRAKRMTTAAVMRGWSCPSASFVVMTFRARGGYRIVERERRLDVANPNVDERSPLLGISPGVLEVGDSSRQGARIWGRAV